MARRAVYGSALLVVAVLAISIAGFLATISAAQTSAGRIHSLADTALVVSFPSIDSLAAVRTGILEVELALSNYIHSASRHDVARRDLAEAQEDLREQVATYLALPLAEGEQSRWSSLQLAFARFEASVGRARERSDTDPKGAAQLSQQTVAPAAAQVIDLALEAIRFHAERGRSVASEIKIAHERSRLVAFVFGGLWTLVSIAGILLVVRQARHREHAAREHARFVGSRMQELEAFAGRVAHDIRNPLAAARMAFELIARRSSDLDAKIRDQGARGIRSLQRAEAIIAGLLEFARAGAAPEPGARTAVCEAATDMIEGLQPEAQTTGIDIELDLSGTSVLAACSTGVYLSCLDNLVRNAMKYMGEGRAERRIVVNISGETGLIRTQVTDTGPGIPHDVQPSIFEPFFRARGTGQGGIGLGLATVQRLVRGHGGEVGVVSTPGCGSTFWFTLPSAGLAAANADELEAASALQSEQAH
jgi:signal transduction histidine kinase